jgi:hypothetical protein
LKIRNGFVSNSSTSSFIVHGFCIDENNQDEVAKKLNLELDEDSNILTQIVEELESRDIDTQYNMEWGGGDEQILIGPYTGIDYLENITDFIKDKHEERLKIIEGVLGWKPENAEYWGIKADC